jgi:carboxymethylenebutenolidase
MLDSDHLNSLQPPAVPLNRRALVKASLTIGFCAAVSPVLAQVVTTSAEGLVAGQVLVLSGGGDIPAYRAMPDRRGPFPTMLVVHEIFGVHEYIKDVCRRWAKLGYYAIAPELFARQGDASAIADAGTIMKTIVAKLADSQVTADLDATFAFAKASGSADVSRAAVTGFCWGGRQVWLYAAHNPELKAPSPVMGRWPSPWTDCIRRIRPTSSANSRFRCLAFTAARTAASRSRRSRR